jgi:dephospho-CoA kinase
VNVLPSEACTWRLGVTGGIGSGKSTVAGLLHARGATLIDADAISRASTQRGGAAMPAIAHSFGSDILAADGSLDRQRMRQLIFEQPAARQVLESIIHPLVSEEIERQAAMASSRCLVFDVPLLVESPRWRIQLDRIVVVDCSPETQVCRVHKRNAWDRESTLAIMRTQSTREQRLAAADLVVCNEGSLADLEALVDGFALQFGL